MEKVNAVVKVGKRSCVNLINCNLYRAITVDEMEITVSKYSDINVAIIESISAHEQESIKQFIRNYTSIGNNHVIFYIRDEKDNITSGIADELEYDILMTPEALYNELERLTGVNVSIKLFDEDKDANSELVDTNEQLSDMTEEAVNNEVENVKENTIASLLDDEANDDTEDEVRQLQLQKERLETKVDSLNKQVTGLAETLSKEKEKNSNLEKKVAELEQENSVLSNSQGDTGKLEALLKEKESLEDKVAELGHELNSRVEELEKIKAELERVENELKLAKDADTNSLYELSQANEKVKELEGIVSDLKESRESAVDEIREKEDIISQKEKSEEELNNRIKELEEEVTQLNQSIDDNPELEELRLKYDEVCSAKQECEQKLMESNEQLNDIMEKIGGDTSIVESLKSSNEVLSTTNNALNSKVAELETRCTTLQNSNKALNENLNTLRESEQQLKDSLSALGSVGMSNGDITVPAFEYTGKAKIINVFGHGSHGITTFAMSACDRLSQSSKVVVVDMDITSPSLDQWANMSPYSKDMSIGLDQIYRTGLAVFVKSGISHFMSYSGMINQLKASKAGSVDYINGIYGKVSSAEIASAQYSKLFEYLGENYDYIVVDSGKLGESSVHDSLIRDISEIAHSNIYVINGASKIQVNAAMKKIHNASIDISRVYAFINLVTNSGISEIVKKMIKGMKYSQMHADTNLMFKSGAYFNYCKLTKDKFEIVMNEIA